MREKTTMAKRIQGLRNEAGLTQAQLSERTGITLSAIRSYENGLREPNSKAMAALERFFNVSGEYLRGEVNRATFLSKSDDVQGELDDLINIFMSFKDSFERAAQDDQLLAVAALEEVIHLLSAFVLSHRCYPYSLTLDELMTPMRAVFDLNAEGRAELVKRAIELTELPKYSV